MHRPFLAVSRSLASSEGARAGCRVPVARVPGCRLVNGQWQPRYSVRRLAVYGALMVFDLAVWVWVVWLVTGW